MKITEERKVDALVRELVQGPLHEVCELPDIYDMQQIPTRKPRAVSGSHTPDSSNLEEPNDRPPDERRTEHHEPDCLAGAPCRVVTRRVALGKARH